MVYMDCFYCNTPLDSEMNRCEFCGSEVRENRVLGSHMMLGDALQNVPVLHTYHTYDLTVCLRLLRDQQTVTYGELIEFNKNGVSAAVEEKRKEYLYWKRRI